MYKSTIHTPASNCSAGTGISGGPARSVFDPMDDFDMQLKEKLGASREVAGIVGSKDAAERAAERVAEWRRNMDALLDGEDGVMIEEEGYVSGEGMDDGIDDAKGEVPDGDKAGKNEDIDTFLNDYKKSAGYQPLEERPARNNEETHRRMILEF